VIYQGLIEGLGNTWIGLRQFESDRKKYQVIVCWTDPARSYDHVVVIAHSPYSLDNFAFIVRNNLNPFQFNAQLKTVFGYGIRGAQRQN
jgi:hypothetical protein